MNTTPPEFRPEPPEWRRGPRLPLWRSVSMRLLLLTITFVMLSEVLIFVPSVARFRVAYMEDRLGAALLALNAVEATPDGMVDMELQRRLLSQAGALGMEVWRPDRSQLTLGPDMPPKVDASYDIRRREFFPLIGQALMALVRTEPRIIAVMGHPPQDPQAVVDVVIEEQPMIQEMRGYGWRILALSAVISLITAALVYLSLHFLLVRPLLRMSANMQAFRDAPEDAGRVLRPSRRTDEIGMAERALAEMQIRLRAALRQQARLAAVGTAVSKISHDLKGVLTTAMLESDRLEVAAADPEVKHVTHGIARALDRAVNLCTTTLRFAKEGPPAVRMRDVALRALVEGAVQGPYSAPDGPGCRWQVDVPEDLTVRADPDLLLRALENLCRNAAEAGASQVRIGAYVRDSVARITVSDDGPGLPPKALENLFVPFSGSARVGGTGLGLPITRELMQAQGGSVELAKSDDTGATFVLLVRHA